MKIEDFYGEYMQDVFAQSGAEANFTRSVFLDYICTILESEGTIATYSLTEHKMSSRGQAVDAWYYDEKLARLNLILADYRQNESLETLTNTEIKTCYKRLRKFISSTSKKVFVESLEEADPVQELAWFLNEKLSEIDSINLILISNAHLSSRVAELPNDKVGSLKVTYELWDFGRIFRSETSGKSREDIEIDLTKLQPKGVRCLPAYTGKDSLKSYLLVMPGQAMSDLYGEYGDRLLEQNVRTFLQFRGVTNKGMRNTIKNEPHMFFSYNNGLCATAEDVTADKGENYLLSVKNLQIVNGGQTTASIFNAHKKDDLDLSNVYVQIKLSVVQDDQVETIVPLISEYSNSQNKVNSADFASNHPFQMRFEELSRRIFAPSTDGGVQQTLWFYERTRGQYANKQNNLTSTDKKKFLAKNPRRQMFTKTDLAKYYLTMEELPHTVSLGAQKAFSGSQRIDGFVKFIPKLWGKDGKNINDVWLKQMIAKAIMFRELDRLVFRMAWYAGYKANIVTYTLAKFSSMVGSRGVFIDYLEIWKEQKMPDPIRDYLLKLAEEINDFICSPPDGETRNISEWAKKENCWIKCRDGLSAKLPSSVQQLLIDGDKISEQENEGSYNQSLNDSIQGLTYIIEKGAAHWVELAAWNMENRKLTAKESSILKVACSIPNRLPSDKQAELLANADKRAIRDGFFIEK